MSNLLLTGFEPFGGFSYNPSAEIARQLDGSFAAGVQVRSLVLPVVFGEDIERVMVAIAAWEPVLILSLGLNSGTDCLDVERFAMNLRYAENGSGLQPIVADGPAAYMSTLQVEDAIEAIELSGAPARAHCYAGSYLCNHVMYQSLHYLSRQPVPVPCGFIHLPHAAEFLTEPQASSLPSYPLQILVRGVQAALETGISYLAGTWGVKREAWRETAEG